MNNDYKDIRDRIAEQPKWFDEHAVPRYCDFSPDEVANIYATEAALALIECQNCRERFRVAFSWSMMDQAFRNESPLSQNVVSLHYGDPPNINCCPAGPTMNCIDVRVIEFWSRENFEWKRRPELEIELDDD